LILLSPADDLNYQIKKLGKNKFYEWLKIARRMTRAGKGKELMPAEVEPSYFSAKRYYEIYNTASIEGNLFNYEGKLRVLSKVKMPILAIFGSKEEFAAMPPRKMLRKLNHRFQHPASKTALIKDADHCFCMQEEEVEAVVAKWISHLP
jgi:pimeloyl-ACP methyl ester carboxylesterase